MSAAVQLRLLPPPVVAPPVPASGVTVRREWTCGCVTRGRWIETSKPPIRWWLSRGTLKACELRQSGKSCAAVRGEGS